MRRFTYKTLEEPRQSAERPGATLDGRPYPLIPLQLTHSGRYSHPRRIIACHNPLIDRTDLPPGIGFRK